MNNIYYGDNVEFYNEDTIPNRMGRGATLKSFLNGGDVRITNGTARIAESIEDILSTPVGCRFFLPQYGSKLHLVVFEQNDFIAKDLAIEYVTQALGTWEPRINVEDISVDIDGTVMEIYIKYVVKDTGTPDNYVYTIERQVPELV